MPALTRRSALALGLAVPAAVTMAASGAASGGSGDAGGEPQQGGTLTYLEPQTWATLYPPAGGSHPNGGVLHNSTDRLLHQNPATPELEPRRDADLAQVNRSGHRPA